LLNQGSAFLFWVVQSVFTISPSVTLGKTTALGF